MKNLLFWGGLFLATFWDEMLLMATEPKKTKRQQQFLQTGETSQYFIGAVEDELVVLLKSIFKVKVVPKSNKIYLSESYKSYGTTIYEINGGIRNGGMTMMVDSIEIDGPRYYNLFILNGYKGYYDDYEGIRLFGNNGAKGYLVQKEEALYHIWEDYIMEWKKYILIDEVENFEQIIKIADSGDYELAFILLSGVPNIKEILL
jgi:hypothetical protein